MRTTSALRSRPVRNAASDNAACHTLRLSGAAAGGAWAAIVRAEDLRAVPRVRVVLRRVGEEPLRRAIEMLVDDVGVQRAERRRLILRRLTIRERIGARDQLHLGVL